MSIGVSASSLQRVAACPASTVFPQVDRINEDARRGTEIHSFLERCATLGRDAALELVPEDMQDACAAIDLSQIPIHGPAAATRLIELAMAFDLATGRARILGERLERRYETAPTEVPGTSDIVWHLPEEDRAIVLDYKSGHAVLPEPRQNWQLRHLALCASRCFGVRNVQVVIVQVTPGYTPKCHSAHFSEIDLDAFEAELQDVYRSLLKVRAANQSGQALKVVMGDHCTYCPAIASCPGMRAMAAQFLANGESSVVPDHLSPELAARAWTQLRALKRLVDAGEKAIKDYATTQPLELDGGKILGPVETSNEFVDGAVAVGVLREQFGPEVADAAVEYSTSKTAIKAAITPIAKRRGVSVAHLERSTLEAIRQRRGVRVTKGVSIREHLPKRERAGA